MRLALIGAGRWGRIVLRTIAGLPGVTLTRLGSGNPDSLALAPKGCVVETDWRQAVTAPDVDAVIIATPPQTHAEICLAALRAHKPVLVEKPLTLDLAEAEAILAEAERLNGLVWVEQTQLFQPGWAMLKQLLPGLGRLRALRSEAGNHGPFRIGAPVLWDWGAHDIAMALDLTGTVPTAIASRRLEHKIIDGGDGALHHIRLEFGPDLSAEATLGNLFPSRRRRFALHGEAGVLVLDDVPAARLSRHAVTAGFAWPEGAGETVTVSPELPLSRAVRLFAAAVRRDDRSLNSLRLGVRVVRILAACG
ncbi:Predicted dehydrogenase and related protein [Candidatus Terasakiella magnetica]|nr:Predicted dehydrogenase and related protein [Candidatus Terasakiella magnetica]